jgi:uncharacterized protein YbjQ (UPF0145 family)
MIVTAALNVTNRKVTKILAVVKGRANTASHHLSGAKEEKEILSETREAALDQMVQEAKQLFADAVIGLTFVSSEAASHVTDILAYGTAVKLDPAPPEKK